MHDDLGPIGTWTFALDAQPAARAPELAAEIEEMGYGAIWVPEAVGRDPKVNAMLIGSATRRVKVCTGIASIDARVPRRDGRRALPRRDLRELVGALG